MAVLCTLSLTVFTQCQDTYGIQSFMTMMIMMNEFVEYSDHSVLFIGVS